MTVTGKDEALLRYENQCFHFNNLKAMCLKNNDLFNVCQTVVNKFQTECQCLKGNK